MTDGEADGSVTRRGFILGSAGAAAAGAAGTAAAQEGGSGGHGSSGGNSSSGGGGGPTKTVKVGPGGNLTFEPSEVTIPPGGTIKWVWESNTHNVVPESQPSGSSWQGSPGAPSKTYDSGYTYSHTFDTPGEYAYFCQPHKSAGMTGTITVGSTGGGGSSAPAIPSSAKTLGVATSGALAFTLGLAYFFMKFGGDYGEYGEYE
ncbi:plastocyanin/azurin family copper-binding protein [Haladaptatus salinisoli]|uniref:plastocyanin/azurin family copper-binding protein n=1 Tax=Haladaptatus salinisoli TaxID=2884876 RepID=UPI001D09D642|nr:plastocyanin/azurin family copper-binding protein [Haladaptatus salinisoli]